MPQDHPVLDTQFSFADDFKDDMNNSFYPQHYGPSDYLTPMGLVYDDAYGPSHLLSGSIDPVLPRLIECRSSISDDYLSEENDWKKKHVKFWEPSDILHWINYEANSLGEFCTDLAGEKFATLDGVRLIELTERGFENYDKKHGRILYERLQHIIRDSNRMQYSQLMPLNSITCENTNHDQMELKHEISSFVSLDMKDECIASSSIHDLDKPNEAQKFPEQPPEKKKAGRPRGTRRKKKPQKLGRLWEFIRDLLKNEEYCPSLIQWDNYEEGMFRFVHSDKVAKLWGTKKDNPDMNYEKLSRAMRYYYKSRVLLPVLGRRLVYKFGPKATGWQVDNPNFKH